MLPRNHLKIIFHTAFTLTILRTISCDTFRECENIPAKTFTASSTNCSDYIYCDGDESFQSKCEDGTYFNDGEKVCDDMEYVNCYIEGDTDGNASTPAILTTMATTSTTTAAADLSTTSITVTASPITSGTSTSTTSTASAIITTTEISLTSDTKPATTTKIISSTTPTSISSPVVTFNECPPVDNPFQIIFMASSRSCSEYFICINGTPIEMFCSGMLHFNSVTGKCDYPENVGCLPDYSKPKEYCRRNVVDFYPHSSNCNYFYLCQNGFLLLQQCPLFYGWDMEKRNCVAMNKAKCYA